MRPPHGDREEIERALATLVGLRLGAAERLVDLLVLRLGTSSASAVPTVGDEVALHVACAWRITDGERVLVGSGDLFTPADPDDEPETFDWEPEGASWLDVRLGELAQKRAAQAAIVDAVAVDPFGGARLAFSDGLVLEIFPNSTPTGHVSTEFWRLALAGTGDLVVGTFGVERESPPNDVAAPL